MLIGHLALDVRQVLEKAERGERVALRYANVMRDELDAAQVLLQLSLHLRCQRGERAHTSTHIGVYT